MRELIRPALFLMARLGLFLSVVAWIVGQSLTGGVACPPGIVMVCGKGWVCVLAHGLPFAWEFPVSETPSDGDDGLFVQPPKSDRRTGFSLCGLTGWHKVGQTTISVRHWLVVTIFALFYGVLKWVYRTRETEIAANE